MATNEILPFASTNTGTNLLTQAEYSADAQRTTGNQPGIARSKLVNKALRQSSLLSAGLAEFIADYQTQNVTDGLTAQNIADYLLDALLNTVMPVGTTIYVPFQTAPNGFIKANGAAISRTTYSRLFEKIGTTFGVGNGTTTFNLPDLRGEFLRCFDDGRGIDSGRVLGSWQKGTYVAFDLNWDGVWTASAQNQSYLDARQQVGVDAYNTSDYATLHATGAPIANQHPIPPVDGDQFSDGIVRPRNIALLACIKY